MDLIERCLAGIELRDPSRVDPRPLDFAVSNESSSLLMLANWWTSDWGMGTSIVYVPAIINPKTLTFEGLESQGVVLGTATDGFFADMLEAARYRTDVDRGRYYRELQKLVDFEPGFNFHPWIETILTRPTIDAREVMRAQQTGRREIGIIGLRDHTDVLVDALAIDARGQVATSQDEGWLALFAAQWAGYADGTRPDITSFLGWLAQQRPYGPFTLDEPQVTSAEGELDAFITSAFNTNPAI